MFSHYYISIFDIACVIVSYGKGTVTNVDSNM